MDLLKAMRVFVSVTDEASFAGAARALDLAPAIVTRQIAQLEARLGARLINRTTRRLALTEAGEHYLERVRAILTDIEDAETVIGASAREPSGMLRVRAPSLLLTQQLVRRLPEFRSRYPRIALQLLPAPMVSAPDEGADLTLIVARGEHLDGDFVARRLACTEGLLVASPDYLARRGRPSHPLQLEQHDLLIAHQFQKQLARDWRFERRGGSGRPQDSVVISGQGLQALSTSHLETLHEAALTGLGIMPTLSFVAEPALRRGDLVRVLPQWQFGQYTLFVAQLGRKHQPARLRAFTDFLFESLGGNADRDPWLDAIASSAEQRAGGEVLAA